MSRTGTIANAVAQPNETYVYLDAVTVDKIKASEGYFVIREPWDFQSRIVVYSHPPSAIRMGQMVDIEGTMGTLRGQRVILDASIIGYFDERDHLLLHPPFMKGFMAPTQWAYKEELADIGRRGGFSVMDEFPPEPNPNPLPPPTFYASIADLLNDDPPDDTIVQLDCHPVESVESTYFVMGDDGGQDTLAVYYTDPQSRRVNMVTGTMATDGNDRVLNVDSGPGFDPQGYVGHVTYVTDETIQWARTFADDTELEIGESEAEPSGVVTAVFPAVYRFYMQTTPNPIAGIRVDYTGDLPAEGDVVTVTGGTVTTDEGERVISNPSDVETTDTDTFEPLGMNHQTLGGGPFDQYTPGVTGGIGLYSLGLLVRTYGRVTALGVNCFYLDDGSGVANDTSQGGLKVSWAWGDENGNPYIIPPAVGAVLQVDGVSASEACGTSIIRVLRLRKQSDIHFITAFPSIAITVPPGEEIHKPSSQTTIRIEGTASANGGSSVTLVEVAVVSGHNQSRPTVWPDATGTTNWYYDWTSVTTGNYTIWAKATNEEGLVADVSRNITVSNISNGVIYVDYSKSDDTGNGESWGTAKKTVQAGIDTADTNNKSVWVKGSSQNPYVGCFTLKSGVKLYGGFDGTENYLEQRDWKKNETILDGDAQGSVVTFESGSTSDTRIDGFTIRNGLGTWDETNYCYNGGGIYSASCSGMVVNNTIADNIAEWGGFGGAVYCNSSSTMFTRNIIQRNSAGYGGAIYCYDSTALISHNIISFCQASQGGGVYLEGSAATVADNVIISNQADYGCGILCTDGEDKIVNNTVVGNYWDGGAVEVSGSATVANNIVAYNTSYGVKKNGGNATFQYNDVYANVLGNYSGLTKPATDINSNPGFISVYGPNLHISWDSPCKDAGTEVEGMPDEDIDGEARVYPTNGDIDIGADEWNGAYHLVRIVRVKTDGDDVNDGSTWTLAKATIQASVNEVMSMGGEVWVAEGEYDEAVRLPAFVGLYGGFDGTESLRSQRDWETNVTTIDAYGLSTSAVQMDAAFHTTLDGFTIKNGSSSGVRVNSGLPVISNNNITENTGSGIYCSSSPTIGGVKTVISDNVISDNSATNGGGVYCFAGSPEISGNTIESNTASGMGGGVYCRVGSSPSVIGNTILSNTASNEGGGVMCDGASGPIIEANIFDSNVGADHGGAIAMHESSVRIANNLFVHNHCNGSVSKGGGAIHGWHSTPTVVNNTFVENWVGAGDTFPPATPNGFGGAIHIRSTASAKIINNVFLNNVAYQGNSVGFTDSGNGSVTYCDAFSTGHGESSYHYYGITPGTGCVLPGVDPQLCDVSAGHFWLQSSSPLYTQYHGQGNDNDTDVPTSDIHHHSRPGLDAYTDMGAYETDGRNCP